MNTIFLVESQFNLRINSRSLTVYRVQFTWQDIHIETHISGQTNDLQSRPLASPNPRRTCPSLPKGKTLTDPYS